MTPEQHAAEIRKLEPAMAAAYLADVRAVEGAVSSAEVERLIREDDQNGLVALLSLGAMSAFTELFRAAFVAGARNELAGRYRFDANTWAVVNLLMESISGIQDQAELDLRATVAQVMANGQSVRNKSLNLLGVISKQTGRRSGGVIGLPVQMTEWVESARNELLSSDPASLRAYLRRKSRDISFDSMVKAMLSKQEEAINKGVATASNTPAANRPIPKIPPLPEPTGSTGVASRPSIEPPAPQNPGAPAPPKFNQKDADKIVKGYASKLSKANADRIAKNAASSAYNAGRYQSIKQMIENGLVSSSDVTKRWKTQRDERVRSSHASMNNQRVGFDAPFTSGLGGLLMYPCDTSMGASEQDIYGCRCQVEYVIKRRG